MCRVDGCPFPILIKKHSLCSAHYQRFWKYGDPMSFMPIRTGKTAYEIVMERTRPPRPDEPKDCLIYTGPTKNGGYGVLQFDNRKLRAHRVVMEHHNGPSAQDVLHSCDYKPCVNIDHLRYGDYSDNYEDRVLNRGESTRLCEVPLCTRKHAAKGMCQMHYLRELRRSTK